jgi:dTDP-4-dehydrorhamnose reductase
MLKLAQERDALNVINDQIGAPTGADLLADITAHAIRSVFQRPEKALEYTGLYHLVASGETSWHGYANFVIDFARRAGLDIRVLAEAISPVPSSAFPSPAARPKNSRLDTSKLQSTFDFQLPPWQNGVSRMLSEIVDRK